jgi:hypothetical protein
MSLISLNDYQVAHLNRCYIPILGIIKKQVIGKLTFKKLTKILIQKLTFVKFLSKLVKDFEYLDKDEKPAAVDYLFNMFEKNIDILYSFDALLDSIKLIANRFVKTIPRFIVYTIKYPFTCIQEKCNAKSHTLFKYCKIHLLKQYTREKITNKHLKKTFLSDIANIVFSYVFNDAY